MQQERREAIVEEVGEVADLRELKALWCFGGDYGDADFVPLFKEAVHRLRGKTAVLQREMCIPQNTPVQGAEAEVKMKVGAKSIKKYRLLSTDVGWSTKGQVHALAAILGANFAVGEVFEEAAAVAAVEANVGGALQTRQGGERIWKYYRGRHVEGLEEHGNIVEVK